MGKKLIGIAVIVIMLFGILGLGGCTATRIVYADYEGDYGEYEPLQLVMSAGETYTVTANHFRGLDVEFDKFELVVKKIINPDFPNVFNEDAVAISENIITAKHNGFVQIGAYIYEPKENGIRNMFVTRHLRAWYVVVGLIQVINIDEMTEIRTVRELQDMALDPKGNYILKSDIDLAGFDWEPVRLSKGSFINPDGFVISNLTIKSLNINNQYLGFFGSVYGAYIDGVMLEKINIDYTTILFSPSLDPSIKHLTIGGIAGIETESFIVNCRVEGKITALHSGGGIAGESHYGIIKNCEFNGTVTAQQEKGNGSTRQQYAGGVVGTAVFNPLKNAHMMTGIYDCKANAEIVSSCFAGGILGYYLHDPQYVKNCIFVGTTQGELGSGEIFGYSDY